MAAGLGGFQLAALFVTGAIRDYRPRFHGLGRAIRTELARHTIGLWRGDRPAAGGRLNPVQQLLYAPLLLLVLPGLAVTGLLLLLPEAGPPAWRAPRPEAVLAAIHAILALIASLFLVLHLYMATMAEPGRMRLRATARTLILAVLWMGVAPRALAEQATGEVRQPVLPCFGCHSGTPTSRRIVVDPRTGARKDVTVELARKAQGVHAKLACQTCHSRGFERFPHRPAAERRFPACRDCHPRREPAAAAAADAPYDFARIEGEHGATRHATVFRKLRGERDCEGCHHPHYMRTSAALGLPERLRADHDAPCRGCHQAGVSGPLADPVGPTLERHHDAVPHGTRHLAAVRCVDCHTRGDRPLAHDLAAGNATRVCTECHRARSSLIERLYRFVPAIDRPDAAFGNPGLLEERYVLAVNRPLLLDRVLVGGLGVLGLAIGGHLLLRVAARRRAPRRPATE